MDDEILKEALIISMNRYIEDIPSNEELIEYHKFSNDFDKKMKVLIKKSNIKYVNINKFKIRRSFVASIFIIIMIKASMSVEAFKIPVVKLTEKIYTEFSEIIFNNEKNIEVPNKIEKRYIPAYIPDGYEFLEKNESMRSMQYIIYANDEGQELMVEQLTLNVSMAVDTEGITTEEITINEMNGIIYTKNGLTSIIVNDNSYVHVVNGYETREELIKIVQSLYIRE